MPLVLLKLFAGTWGCLFVEFTALQLHQSDDDCLLSPRQSHTHWCNGWHQSKACLLTHQSWRSRQAHTYRPSTENALFTGAACCRSLQILLDGFLSPQLWMDSAKNVCHKIAARCTISRCHSCRAAQSNASVLNLSCRSFRRPLVESCNSTHNSLFTPSRAAERVLCMLAMHHMPAMIARSRLGVAAPHPLRQGRVCIDLLRLRSTNHVTCGPRMSCEHMTATSAIMGVTGALSWKTDSPGAAMTICHTSSAVLPDTNARLVHLGQAIL